jgi:hypothetical protein
MAKHGIVALTRAFKFGEPKVFDTEGIKCFALAPWFADTALGAKYLLLFFSSRSLRNVLVLLS